MPGLSIFGSLNTAILGTYAQKAGMSVVSHNVSNANTDGYSRQRVDLETTLPLTVPTIGGTMVQFGTGVQLKRIERIRDAFLDRQYRHINQYLNKWQNTFENLHMVEELFNEPSDNGIRNLLDRFWQAVEELSNSPSDGSARAQLVETAKELGVSLKNVYSDLQGFRKQVDNEIVNITDKINTITAQLANLNGKIRVSSLSSGQPNDLLDKRDKLLDELSGLIDINVKEKNNGEVKVLLGAQGIVVGNTSVPFEIRERSDGSTFHDIYLFNNRVQVNNGKLNSLFSLRDDILKKYTNKLDEFSFEFIDRVNEIHESGFGANGAHGVDFFKPFEVKDDTVYKIMGKYGVVSSSALLSNVSSIDEKTYRISINDTDISVNASKESLQDLIDKINALKSGVEASLGPDNQLALRATASVSYDLASNVTINDKDGLLQSLGFTVDSHNMLDYSTYLDESKDEHDYMLGTPKEGAALKVDVNGLVENNPLYIAADAGKSTDTNGDGLISDDEKEALGPGSNSNALKIAALKTQHVLHNCSLSFNDFFTGLISELGTDSETAKNLWHNNEIMIKQVTNEREKVKGVSIDEEMSKMVLYQHAFNASARVVTAIDEMLDKVVNGLGIVGR